MQPGGNHAAPMYDQIGNWFLERTLKRQILLQNHGLVGHNQMVEFDRPIHKPDHHHQLPLLELLVLDHGRVDLETGDFLDLAVHDLELALVGQTALLEAHHRQMAVSLVDYNRALAALDDLSLDRREELLPVLCDQLLLGLSDAEHLLELGWWQLSEERWFF